jgi:hypothetical protein
MTICQCQSHGTGPDGKIQDHVQVVKSNVPGTNISSDRVEENDFCTESTVKSFLTQIKDAWEFKGNLYYGKRAVLETRRK